MSRRLPHHYGYSLAAVLMLFIALVAAGCSTSTDSVDTSTDTSIADNEDTSVDETGAGADEPSESEPADEPAAAESVNEQADESAATDAAATESEPTQPAATETPVAAAEPAIRGAELIGSDTPVSGQGLRPTLTWDTVDGAAEYHVVVRDANEEPYWSWTGTESQVTIPGGGPVVQPGYSWSVSAWGPDDEFLAISAFLPIEP